MSPLKGCGPRGCSPNPSVCPPPKGHVLSCWALRPGRLGPLHDGVCTARDTPASQLTSDRLSWERRQDSASSGTGSPPRRLATPPGSGRAPPPRGHSGDKCPDALPRPVGWDKVPSACSGRQRLVCLHNPESLGEEEALVHLLLGPPTHLRPHPRGPWGQRGAALSPPNTLRSCLTPGESHHGLAQFGPDRLPSGPWGSLRCQSGPAARSPSAWPGRLGPL